MEEEPFRGHEEHVNKAGVNRLRALLGNARVAMLTTADPCGALKSRPMVVQQIDDEGEAWLVTDEGSGKVHDVRREWNVNLSWLRPVRGRWIAANGRATVVRDREKLAKVWDPGLQLWFPAGVDDPHVCLLRVRLDEAVTWNAPLGNLLQLTRLAGTLLRRAPRGGEQGRETIRIRSQQAGVGDTAGILGAAGGSMGSAPRAPKEPGGPRVAGAAGGSLGEAPLLPRSSAAPPPGAEVPVEGRGDPRGRPRNRNDEAGAPEPELETSGGEAGPRGRRGRSAGGA
jgi:general stress protein 26